MVAVLRTRADQPARTAAGAEHRHRRADPASTDAGSDERSWAAADAERRRVRRVSQGAIPDAPPNGGRQRTRDRALQLVPLPDRSELCPRMVRSRVRLRGRCDQRRCAAGRCRSTRADRRPQRRARQPRSIRIADGTRIRSLDDRVGLEGRGGGAPIGSGPRSQQRERASTPGSRALAIRTSAGSGGRDATRAGARSDGRADPRVVLSRRVPRPRRRGRLGARAACDFARPPLLDWLHRTRAGVRARRGPQPGARGPRRRCSASWRREQQDCLAQGLRARKDGTQRRRA